MNRAIIQGLFLICGLLADASSFTEAYAQDDDVFRRLDFLKMNASDVMERCSYDTFSENINDSKNETKYSAKASHRVHHGANKLRVDQIDMTSQKDFANHVRSYMAIPELEVLSFPTESPIKPDTIFSRREHRKGINKRDPILKLSEEAFAWNPGLACLCEVGIFPSHVNQQAKAMYDHTVLETIENQDGTTTVALLGKEKKYGHEIIFQKDPDFLPIKVIAWSGILDPKNHKTANSAEELRRLAVLSTTTTKWKKIDDLYVPEMIEYQGDYWRQKRYKRVLFLNWQLGAKVDVTGLAEQSMTDAELSKLSAVSMAQRVEKAVAEFEENQKKAKDK